MKSLPSLTFHANAILRVVCVASAACLGFFPRGAIASNETPPVRMLVGARPARGALEELHWCRDRVLAAKSIQAGLVETIQVLEHSYRGEGRYVQGHIAADDLRLRLELTLHVGSVKGTLLEVCDGQILWTRHDVSKVPTITRRNVRQILEAGRLNKTPENVLRADLGVGGLPALLSSLELSMTFNGSEAKTLRDRPVTVIQGQWIEAYQRLWQPQADAPLPAFVPDLVQVYIDQETGFPLRIWYLKKLPQREKPRSMLVLDFKDILIDQPLDASDFEFKPPNDAAPIEVTPHFLNQLVAPPAPASPAVPAPAATPDNPG